MGYINTPAGKKRFQLFKLFSDFTKYGAENILQTLIYVYISEIRKVAQMSTDECQAK